MGQVMKTLVGCMPVGFVGNYILPEYTGTEAFQVWLCTWVLAVALTVCILASRRRI